MMILELRYHNIHLILERMVHRKIQDLYKNKGQQEITTPVLRLELSKFVVHRQTLLSRFQSLIGLTELILGWNSFSHHSPFEQNPDGWRFLVPLCVSLSYRRARSLSQLSWVFDAWRCELFHAYQKYCPSMGQIGCRISPNKKNRTRHIYKVRIFVSRQVLIGL